MAKVKKTLVLDEEVVALLDEYADLLGVSRSSVANDMLLEALPMLKVVIDELKAFLEKNRDAVQPDLFEDLQKKLFIKVAREIEKKV